MGGVQKRKNAHLWRVCKKEKMHTYGGCAKKKKCTPMEGVQKRKTPTIGIVSVNERKRGVVMKNYPSN